MKPGGAPEALELGEASVASLSDVRCESQGGVSGTLTVTSRNLRFTSEGRVQDSILHGFPDIGALLRGGDLRLVIPLTDIASVAEERGIFRKVVVTTRGGARHVFHVGLRDPGAVVRALSR